MFCAMGFNQGKETRIDTDIFSDFYIGICQGL